MEKTLIILRGLPGAGKSKVADFFADGIYPVCTADDYFMKDGEYKFDVTKLGAAHKKCQEKCRTAMANGITKIYVANTNTTVSELNAYTNLAEEFGYKVISLIVENRHGNSNVHNVPAEALTKMKDRFDIKLI